MKKYTVTRFIFAVILWISQIVLSALAQQPQSLTNPETGDARRRADDSLNPPKFCNPIPHPVSLLSDLSWEECPLAILNFQ